MPAEPEEANTSDTDMIELGDDADDDDDEVEARCGNSFSSTRPSKKGSEIAFPGAILEPRWRLRSV